MAKKTKQQPQHLSPERSRQEQKSRRRGPQSSLDPLLVFLGCRIARKRNNVGHYIIETVAKEQLYMFSYREMYKFTK